MAYEGGWTSYTSLESFVEKCVHKIAFNEGDNAVIHVLSIKENTLLWLN